MRGVYDKPEYNSFLQEYIKPSPDKVANAIARNYGWTIVPCGDTALNLLGLSTQVPAIWLNKSYIELLNSDTQASEKFWTLEERIRQDKRSSGVIVKNISRSRLQVIFAQLIADGVICQDDLQSFSEELRKTLTHA